MGTFRIAIEIGDQAGERFERTEALVDTGATFTTVPAPLLDRLGVVSHARRTFVLADGRRVERDIGRTWVRADGRTELTLVVFGDAEAPALLGAYTLEGLLLAADPIGRRLVPVPGLLLGVRGERCESVSRHPARVRGRHRDRAMRSGVPLPSILGERLQQL